MPITHTRVISVAEEQSETCEIGRTEWNADHTLPTEAELETLLRGRYATATYVVFEDGGTYYAKHCLDPDKDYSGAVFATVLNNALANGLTAGRTWQEKVVVDGDFTVEATIIIYGYTILEINGKLTLDDNVNDHLIVNAYEVYGGSVDYYITIIGGILDGNKANQTTGKPLWLEGVRRATVRDTVIKNGKLGGVSMEGAYRCVAQNLVVEDNDATGLFMSNQENEVLGGVYRNNGTYGIALDNATFCTVLDAKAYGNYAGIALNTPSDTRGRNYIAYCKFQNNDVGVALLGVAHCKNNYIVYNTIANNTQGILIQFATAIDNYVHNNTFFGNGTDVFSFAGGEQHWFKNEGYVTENLLNNQTVNIAQTTIAHGMDKTPNNIQILLREDGRVWRSANPDATNIYLQADADNTICDIYMSVE